MVLCPLEKAMQDYSRKEKEVQSILSVCNGLISKWEVNNNTFFILSKCTKKENAYQLTLFRDSQPIFDMIRDSYNHSDFIHELVINECNIDTINYIY